MNKPNNWVSIRTLTTASLLAGVSLSAVDAEAQQMPAADNIEIIVTAQRRSERLTDVPLSITSLTAEDLDRANITDATSLQRVVPGLKIERFGGFTQPAIRGISTLVTLPGSEANVAVYVDGVYMPSMIGNNFEYPDIARVEVAKGPQGTLFGRNATGGAVQVFTKKPSLDTASGKISAGYGRFDDIEVKGFVTAPLIVDKVAFSLAGLVRDRDGYNFNLANNKTAAGLKQRLVRGKLLFAPSENAEITLVAYYENRKDPSQFQALPLARNTLTRDRPGVILPLKPYDVSIDPLIPQKFDVENYGFSGRIDVDFDFARLTSISAYGYSLGDIVQDRDFTNLPTLSNIVYQPQESYSQEITLASTGSGPLTWVGGIFLYKDAATSTQRYLGSTALVDRTMKTRSYAAFGELTYALTDRLNVLGGLRYNHERKSRTDHLFAIPDDSRTYEDLTLRTSVRYEIDRSTNVYLAYSEGVKSGVLDLFSIGAVKPEKVAAYEAGFKTGGGSVRFSAAGFYYDYKDLQVQVTVDNIASLQNAATSEIYGFEGEGAIQLADDFEIVGGFTWLHARYKDYRNGTINVPRATGGNSAIAADLSGNTNVRAPTLTFNATANYSHQFAAGKFELSPSIYYTTRYYLEAGNRVFQPKYAKLSVQASWQPANSGFKFTIWGDNLTDKATIQSSNIGTNADAGAFAPPLTFGGRISYEF